MNPAPGPEHDRAAVLSIGDEIALGQKIDTNSGWIAARLASLGVMTIEHVCVADDAAQTAAAFRRLAAVTPLIVSTGGLGPTADDLTRQALADAMHDTLVEDGAALAQIEAWLRDRGRTLSAANRVQALRPSRGSIMPNTAGTAPGLRGAVTAGSRCADVFCLPGPPREMTAMFDRCVVPALRPARGRTIRARVLHLCGVAESEAATILGDILARDRNPTVGITVSNTIISLRLRHEGTPEEAEAALDETEAAVRARLGDLIFGSGDTTLPAATLAMLTSRKETLAVVESCTGGMIGAALSDVPGSSAAFVGGWITYADAMKMSQTAVPRDVLERHGSVSEPVARAMAEGGLLAAEADHCLAVTGVAGPSGGSDAKPVGTVYISRASRQGPRIESEVRRFLLPGDRQSVRTRTTQLALTMLRLGLLGARNVELLGQRSLR